MFSDDLLERLPGDLFNQILYCLTNKEVIQRVYQVYDINIKLLFSYKYPKLYGKITELILKGIIPKKYKNCWEILYEDFEYIDYDIVLKILNGEYIKYSLEKFKLLISTLTFEVLYTCLLCSACTFQNGGLINIIIINKNMHNESTRNILQSPYTPMYFYLHWEIITNGMIDPRSITRDATGDILLIYAFLIKIVTSVDTSPDIKTFLSGVQKLYSEGVLSKELKSKPDEYYETTDYYFSIAKALK